MRHVYLSWRRAIDDNVLHLNARCVQLSLPLRLIGERDAVAGGLLSGIGVRGGTARSQSARRNIKPQRAGRGGGTGSPAGAPELSATRH